jgi:hypothetical protein
MMCVRGHAKAPRDNPCALFSRSEGMRAMGHGMGMSRHVDLVSIALCCAQLKSQLTVNSQSTQQSTHSQLNSQLMHFFGKAIEAVEIRVR